MVLHKIKKTEQQRKCSSDLKRQPKEWERKSLEAIHLTRD
jgi:hypothetical protein